MGKPKPSEDPPDVARSWFVLPPYTAIDTRTNLRFDARTCTLMITPEFLDWRDERARQATVAPGQLARILERDIKDYQDELRGLIEAGLLHTPH